MKKALLSLVAVAAAFSMNAADWFISGAFQGWSHANADYQFTEVAAGEYEFKVGGNLAGEFLICQGTPGKPDWNNKIGGVSGMVADKEYTYTVGGGNFSTAAGGVDNAVVKFNTNTKKIIITGAQAENEYSEVYLVGDFGDGWSETIKTYPLTLKAGTTNVYEGSYTLTATTSYFKMKAGTLVYGTGAGDVAVDLDTEYTASQSGEAFSIGAGEYTFSFELDKNADTGNLTVTGKIDTPIIPGGDKTLYVIGNFCSWTLSAALKMDHVEGTNVYTLTTDAMDGEEWKINDGTWDWSFGASEGGTQPGVDNDAWFNSSVNFSGITGSTTITFTLVEGSDVEGSATPSVLSYTGAAAPTAPETLYLVGDMLGNHWDPSNGLELEKNGNVFTGTVEIETAFENDYGYFSFCTALGADNEDWNVGTRYGAEALNTPIAAGETVPFVKGDLSWQVLPGKYDVEVDFDANTVSLTANSSGIESVAVESAAAAVYYNLQGVRVAAPEAGSLYIVKRGDKVSKEIVR